MGGAVYLELGRRERGAGRGRGPRVALVARRPHGYPKTMALFRFLFAPALLAVAVFAGHGRHRQVPPPRAPAPAVLPAAPALSAPPGLSPPPAGPEEGARRGPGGDGPRDARAVRAPR